MNRIETLDKIHALTVAIEESRQEGGNKELREKMQSAVRELSYTLKTSMTHQFTFTVDDLDCVDEVTVSLRNEAGRIEPNHPGTANMLRGIAEQIETQLIDKEQLDKSSYVNFGDVSRNRMGMQCQYGSRYIDGFAGYPKLGEGLRFIGNRANYHSILIHKDDVDEFVNRVINYLTYTHRITLDINHGL